MHGLNDTIAAIATAPGDGGLAVVRVSGSRALEIADAIFRGGPSLASVASHTLHHGWIVAAREAGGGVPAAERRDATVLEPADGVGGGTPGPKPRDAAFPEPAGESPAARAYVARCVDEVVVAIFRAPRSYTREDVVEISTHGGASPRAVLAALLDAGARLARPGEFTLRAFLNGRLDLAQAEAVADLIHAETEDARRLALGQLAGELSRRLEAVRAPVEDLLAEVEARVDFAEDVGGVEVPPHVVAGLAAAGRSLADLLAGSAFGRAVREGVRVPLVGAPNAGKSSLFNALLGEERAIVTGEPGTTRDRVSEAVELGGLRFVLSDTAGLRESAGEVEAIGVARSLELLEASPLVVWVIDGARPLDAGELGIAATLAGTTPAARRVVVALNKCDLPARVPADEVSAALNGTEHRVVTDSARTGEGMASLRETLAAFAGGGASAAAALANPRHVEARGRAAAALMRARHAAEAGEPGECVALELRESLGAIGEVTGQSVAEDLLDRIFSRFCVGK